MDRLFSVWKRELPGTTSPARVSCSYRVQIRFFVSLFLLLTGYAVLAQAGEQAPGGNFKNSACVECHLARDSELVDAWRSSAHARAEKPASCVACHGNNHKNAAIRARRDATCIDCHGGAKAPVVHSYTTSKHGVLVRLEQDNPDRPLASANYRAPGCAYCHMHAGNHDINAMVRVWKPEADTAPAELERVQDAERAVCQDCHSPRYVTRLFLNGEGMLNIGRMKVREAAAALELAASEESAAELNTARRQFEEMRSVHLKNLYLGVGHQSPDYQWWHGHPALDGDLLRIKGELGRLRRMKNPGTTREGG